MDYRQIHIGHLIREQMRLRGIKVSWLASKLHCHRNNIYKIFEKSWIDTETLMKISLLLNYNFFYLYSNYYESIDASAGWGGKIHNINNL